MTITEQRRYEIYEAKKILLYDQMNAEEEEFQNYIFFQKLEMIFLKNLHHPMFFEI